MLYVIDYRITMSRSLFPPRIHRGKTIKEKQIRKCHLWNTHENNSWMLATKNPPTEFPEVTHVCHLSPCGFQPLTSSFIPLSLPVDFKQKHPVCLLDEDFVVGMNVSFPGFCSTTEAKFQAARPDLTQTIIPKPPLMENHNSQFYPGDQDNSFQQNFKFGV